MFRPLPPPTEYSCPHCHAATHLRTARAFTLVRCEACGAEWRPCTEIGGYRLLEPLARSGLAVTFRAMAPAAGELLAVKIIRPPLDAETYDFERFTEDVRLLAGFEHPHWLRVFDGGVENDVAWIAMEWLSLGSLAGFLAECGPLAEADVLRFATQAATALAAAQSLGLNHRNLHPGNFLLADAHTLKLGGFAEAIFYERVGRELGTGWGRLCCIPPERLFGSNEDVRSEIYALGMVLFEMLTGTLPYEGEAVIEYFLERLDGSPCRLAGGGRSFQKSTTEMIERMLALDPADRFQTWAEVLDQLEASVGAVSPRNSKIAALPRVVAAPVIAKRPANPATRGIWMTVATLVAIGAVIGGFAWWRTRPESKPATPAPLLADKAPAPAPSPVSVADPNPVRPTAPAPKVAGFDWTGWRTVRLESSKRPKSVHGEAHPIASSSSLRVTGDNTGIAGTSDENVFHARELTGDWMLKARVASNSGVAGLAVRARWYSDDVCLAVVLEKDGKLFSVIRDQPGVESKATPPSPAAMKSWLKLVRIGPVLSAWHSPDGQQWNEVRSLAVPALPPKIPAGFVVWSGSAKKSAGATFEQIALESAE
jgi:serine/threonine-protein kinase